MVLDVGVGVVHGQGQGLFYGWRFSRFDCAMSEGAAWCMYGIGFKDVWWLVLLL